LKPAKVKNISYDGLGTKEGRVHMERQDFEKLQTRKIKALKVLKKRQKYEDAHGGAGSGSEDEGDGHDSEEDEPAPVKTNKRARK
jgi:ribosome production factor 2